MKKIFYISILSSFTFLTSFSQEKIKFHGKIMSSKGFVFNATILNKTTNSGTASGINGDFSISISKSDTLSFSCIGYKTFSYQIPDTVDNQDYRVIITMVADTVSIKETTVTPWPINRSALKQAFLAEKKVEKTKIAFYAGFREIDGPQREPPPTFSNPISLIAQLFNKKRIAKAKTNRIRRILREAKTGSD